MLHLNVYRYSFQNKNNAKAFFQERGIDCSFLDSWREMDIEMELEDALNSPACLCSDALLKQLFSSRNIQNFFDASRTSKIKIFKLMASINRSLTKTELRSWLPYFINWIKEENITFNAEEVEQLTTGGNLLYCYNIIFNYRKTYIKVFLNAFADNVFSMNTENAIVYNRQYAVSHGICPNCGHKLLFSVDNHFDGNNVRRLYCSKSDCVNYYLNSAANLDQLGLEALSPIYDRPALFSDETLVQMEIVLKVKPEHSRTFCYNVEKFLKEFLSLFTVGYSKAELKTTSVSTFEEKYNYCFVTQPMGIKTMKKFLEKVNSLTAIVDDVFINLNDYFEINSKTLRIFNITNIENIYKKSLEKAAIEFNIGSGCVFNLLTMTVTEISRERTIDDAFVAFENGYSLIAKDNALLDILEEEEK